MTSIPGGPAPASPPAPGIAVGDLPAVCERARDGYRALAERLQGTDGRAYLHYLADEREAFARRIAEHVTTGNGATGPAAGGRATPVLDAWDALAEAEGDPDVAAAALLEQLADAERSTLAAYRGALRDHDVNGEVRELLERQASRVRDAIVLVEHLRSRGA
jgi:hypothetical protein